MQTDYVLGVDIGGTHIRAGLVDRDYQLKDFVIQSSPSILADQPMTNIIAFIRGYCDRCLDHQLPKAISIGFPSTVSKDRQMLLNTPNISGLNQIPVVRQLKAAFETEILINRDVNLLVYFDMHFLDIEPQALTTAFYFGTGLGNAISINGELLAGKNGVAAELGHIPMPDNDKVCGCGNIGCIETLASGHHLEEVRDSYFPECKISDIFQYYPQSSHIFRFVAHMAIPVATEVNIIDPDYVILGGGILQMRDFPYDSFVEHIKARIRAPYPRANIVILRAYQEQNNGVIGAGIYAHQYMQKRSQDHAYRVSIRPYSPGYQT